MANIITLPQSRTPDIISHFLDQYSKNQQNRAQLGIQQQQADTQRQQVTNQGDYQKGVLGLDQSKFTAGEQHGKAQTFIDSQIKPRLAVGDTAGAAKAAQDAIAKDPSLVDDLRAWAVERAQNNNDVTAGNVAKIHADTTGRVAGGGTAPNDYSVATHDMTGAFPTAQMFTQQQATDLQGRNTTPVVAQTPSTAPSVPNLKQSVPKPSGNAVSDFEARATEAMPTGAQNQQAQTQLAQTGMQQAGETQRQGMSDAAAMSREKFKVTGAADAAGQRDVKTTVSGQQYADVSLYSGAEKGQLARHYKDMGIPVLDKQGVETVNEINNARLNQQKINAYLDDKLPKDATGRIAGGALSNRLSSFLQTDEYLGAAGAWRTAAIQALRATAGSKGLRITNAEIQLALDNDIPKMTDTLGVAKQKMSIINQLLDSAEQSTLGTTGTVGNSTLSPGQAWAQKHLAAVKH